MLAARAPLALVGGPGCDIGHLSPPVLLVEPPLACATHTAPRQMQHAGMWSAWPGFLCLWALIPSYMSPLGHCLVPRPCRLPLSISPSYWLPDQKLLTPCRDISVYTSSHRVSELSLLSTCGSSTTKVRSRRWKFSTILITNQSGSWVFIPHKMISFYLTCPQLLDAHCLCFEILSGTNSKRRSWFLYWTDQTFVPVVITGPFTIFLLHNHSVNIK